MKDFIIVFNNTHEAIEGEKIFKDNNLKFMIMPTPTYITQSCGISIRFNESEINSVEDLCKKNIFKFKNIYKIENNKLNIYK